jgi:hypothetical protein
MSLIRLSDFWLSLRHLARKTKSIGNAETGMGDRLEAALGEEPMLGGIDRRRRPL